MILDEQLFPSCIYIYIVVIHISVIILVLMNITIFIISILIFSSIIIMIIQWLHTSHLDSQLRSGIKLRFPG